MPICDTYYGNYRTRTFSEIFANYTAFNTYRSGCGVPLNLLSEGSSASQYTNFNLEVIYFMLVSEFANSHIKSSDESRFKLQLMRIIYDNAPVWQRKMYLNAKIMSLTDDDMLKGATAIYNHAMHPDTAPSTATLDELTYIDDQNTNKHSKDKIRAYLENMESLSSNITEQFLKPFKRLFLDVTYPDTPLLYVTEEDT